MNELLIVHPLICPLLAMLALSVVVLIAMTAARMSGMKDVKDPSEIDDRAKLAPHLKGAARRCSDNFDNLLEVPVLFSVLTLLLIMINVEARFYVIAAWVFVTFRILHSLVHCTYNNVMHRFAVFGISSVAFIAMLIKAMLDIAA